MIVFFLIVWGIFTVLAWKKGWKERSLKPFVISFAIGFFDSIFEFGISGTSLHTFISICLFIWLVYMTFTKPKPKPDKSDTLKKGR